MKGKGWGNYGNRGAKNYIKIEENEMIYLDGG